MKVTVQLRNGRQAMTHCGVKATIVNDGMFIASGELYTHRYPLEVVEYVKEEKD